MIDQGQLQLIHGCQSEAVKLADGLPGHYVVVTHGEGMDCPSGCIYQSTAAIVLPSRIALLPEPFPDSEWVRYSINQKLQVALPSDYLKWSGRHFVEKDGSWQEVLTFQRYLKGTVIVNPSRHWETGVVVNATPDGILTADQVKRLAREELTRECQPPPGAQVADGEVRPLDDGSWGGTLLWNLGDQYHKLSYRATIDGRITFDQGCDGGRK